MFTRLKTLESIVGLEYSISCIDLDTGDRYFHKPDLIVSSASTIKIPIMAAAFKKFQDGTLDPHQRISIKKHDKIDYSILTLLDDNNTYSLLDIIILMIIQSDNTATNVMIDLVGMDYINEYMTSLGLTRTKLQRKMLDFDAKRMGRDNLTSAADMVHLMQLLFHGKLADPQHTQLMLQIMKNQLDRSSLYLRIPDEVVIAHKSGQLDKVENEVGIMYLKDRTMAFSIMTWNADSNNLARIAIGDIIAEIYEWFHVSGDISL